MKVQTLGRTGSLEEPPRSTAYYYADLERFRKKGPIVEAENHVIAPRDNDVINDAPIREVPPLRDRAAPSPEYQTPENSRVETYSTAGTFPLAEVAPLRGALREKEPLLLELEEIGRLPLRELSHSHAVPRSRSWYLCCEEREREERPAPAPWRYATLAPVTAVTSPPGLRPALAPYARPAPAPAAALVASTSSGAGGGGGGSGGGRPGVDSDDPRSLRAQRDALARALDAERARAASEARAHDARLAELHGVIAELVRRRAQGKHATTIPEEQLSDECESTTQPCGELEDDSRTEQNDTSSALSLQPTPPDPRPDGSTSSPPNDRCSSTNSGDEGEAGAGRAGGGGSGDSCGRSRGSTPAPPALTAPPAGWCGRRQAKVAARVKLKRSQDADASLTTIEEIRRALGEGPDADLDSVSANSDDERCARGAWWRARALRLATDRAVLAHALSRATDTAHRLSCACAVQESCSVALCCALRAADRALETYDVLLALAETAHAHAHTGTGTHHDHAQREVAERVARRLLARLEAEETAAPAIGRSLLSPGPWLQGESCAYALDECTASAAAGAAPAPALTDPMPAVEGRLREHAARLKAATVSLRALAAPPALFTYHDGEEEDGADAGCGGGGGGGNMADMEVAVAMQELLIAREAEAAERVARLASSAGRPPTQPTQPTLPPPPPQTPHAHADCKVHGSTDRKWSSAPGRRQRHWLDSQQTDL